MYAFIACGIEYIDRNYWPIHNIGNVINLAAPQPRRMYQRMHIGLRIVRLL
jgi:hypothetical protein